MHRSIRILGLLAIIFAMCGLFTRTASAQPTFTNPEVIATNINGAVSGTDNTLFIFRVRIDPGNNQILIPLVGRTYRVGIVTAPWPPTVANPEGLPYPPNGDPFLIMQRDPTNDAGTALGWKACVPGYYIDGFGSGGGSFRHNWAVVARNNTTGGVLMNGTGAAPKPSGTLDVYTSNCFQIMPVDENFLPDKRLIPGQPGNGLRIDPVDPTSPNDTSSAGIFTWRVRIRNYFFNPPAAGGLPPQFFLQRPNYEWRDTRGRFETFPPFVQRYNSGVVLVLVSPDGTKHYCPMEIDPDAPGQGGLQGQYYQIDGRFNPPSFFNMQGDAARFRDGTPGVFYRFRMLPSQYIFNHGPLRGEGPNTAFGGPTLPDSLSAIPIGWGAGADGEFAPGNEVIGRPFANEYVSFAGPDRAPFAPQFPLYTDVLQRSGQWKYYYQATADLRPPTRPGFPDNFICPAPFFPNDVYGSDPNAYNFVFDSDTGPSPGDPSLPYLHPIVTPMLSDGGWTDDLPENGWQVPFGQSRNSHRSRLTTKTRVRFMVRVATAPGYPIDPQLVRVFIDGTDPAHAHPMQPLPAAWNPPDYSAGVVYYYDTTFTQGQEGRHWCFFEADDGIHKVIWPRRDTPTNGTADGRYPDLQALVIPAAKNDPVDFGTSTVGKNFLDEPYVNNPGLLMSQSVTPPSGSQGQPFTYVVNYFDADGDEPMDAIVNIDGIDHRMSAVDTNPTNFAPGGVPTGRKYRFIINALPPTQNSQHNYYFKFRDNWNRLAAYNISTIRREFGQYTTLPPGDDNGNPSSVINGPTIIGNRAPELVDATYTFSDPAKTPATQFDFVVRYKDQDNDPPTTLKVYLSSDGGASYPLQYSLVKAENSNNYTAGVQYHLATRVNLAVGTYRYKFIANDGVNDQMLEHVGTGATAITDGTAHPLSSGDGVNFTDPNGLNFKKWDATPGNIFVWKTNPATNPTTVLLDVGIEYTVTGPDLNTVTLASAAAPGDTFKASYYYLENIGPTVVPNHPPVLSAPVPNPPGDPLTNDGTLTPLAGSPSTSFTYSIKYTDSDNQAPGYVNLVIDTNTTVAMTRDPAVQPPIDYTRGVKYIATVQGSTIGNGTHTYHFEANDGADLARYPAAPNDLSGPKIADVGNLQLPPFGTFTDKPIVPFPKGKSTDNYLFTVVYVNANGLAPSAPIEVRISDNGNPPTITAVTMNPIDPIGPNEYKAGVRYQVQLTAPNAPLTIGQHDVVFAFNGFAAGTSPLTLTVNGPPALSTPLPASGGNFSQAGDITFSVIYKDPNGDVPATIRVIIDPGANQKFIDLTPAPGQPQPLNYVTGVTYQGTIQAKTLSIGNHTFHFTANDGTEDAVVVPNPDATFSVVAAQPPVLSEPGGNASNNNGTLTPLSGARSATYTYSVKYTHPQNVAPLTIQVIIDTGTANQIIRDLTPTTAPPFNYSAGVVYSYTTQPNELNPGSHTYYFKATDRINTATLYQSGTTPYNGPSINNPPALSTATVAIQGSANSSTIGANNTLTPALSGNIFTKFIFRVKYSDPDNVAPGVGGYVRVMDNGNIIPMHKEDSSIDFAGGVFYVTDAVSLAAGQHQFHFEASDGNDPTRLPVSGEVSGISISNLPVLEAPNPPPAADDGTLSPRLGPLSTTFTYKIVYRHPDNIAPASVKVIIDGTAYDMQKVGTGAFSAGVLYQYSLRFASGINHTYRFEAVDTVSAGYTAKYPVDGSTIAGPTSNIPSFTAAVFNPNPGIVGSPMTVSSQLIIAPESETAIAIKYTKPDGTGINTSANTDVNGNFSNQFTPDQTGDWKVEFSWAGQPGVYDAFSTQFTFKVKGYTLNLNSGELDMIASPLVPVTPDPSISFGPTDGSGNPLPVTVLNLIKWDPTAAPAGRYFVLNQDASFPGITGGQSYWVKPDQSVVLNPKGRLWDQTQPYSIPLQPGWNMIGSVYLTNINWEGAKVEYQGQTLNIASAGSYVRSLIWTYNKASGGYSSVDLSGVLQTGRGYWVRAFVPCNLILPPPGARSATITRDAVDKTASIQIMARAGNKSDQDTFVPLTGSTKTRMGLMEKPPYLGDYVSVTLIDPEKFALPADSRASAAGQTVIPFQVETSKSNADVTVQFPNMSTLGRKYEVTLLDLATNNRRSLGTNGGLTFNTGDNATPRRFALLVAQKALNTELRITDVHSSGRGPAGTTFTFTLSSAANVHAQIVSGGGSAIRDLSQGRAATRGANSLVWDGKNAQGAAVPAGTYVLKLTATDDDGHQVSVISPIILVR